MEEKNVVEHMDELYEELRELKKREIEILKEIQEIVNADNASIDILNLCERSYNCLTLAGITTIADLTSLSPDDLMRVKNLGHKYQEEIITKMHKAGLTLRELED